MPDTDSYLGREPSHCYMEKRLGALLGMDRALLPKELYLVKVSNLVVDETGKPD